jgi:hypothetical protein
MANYKFIGDPNFYYYIFLEGGIYEGSFVNRLIGKSVDELAILHSSYWLKLK